MKRRRQHLPERQQTAFGTLLKDARDNNQMSRKDLASKSGIAENSIARYEKAGLEEDGQYPPAQKLAVLCATLKIDPRDAMISCLPAQNYKISDLYWHDESGWNNNPRLNFLQSQYDTILRQNHFMRVAIRSLFFRDGEEVSDKDKSWFQEELVNCLDHQQEFEDRMLQLGALRLSHWMYPTPDLEGPDGWVFDARERGSLADLEYEPRPEVIYQSWKQLKSLTDEIEKAIPHIAEYEVEYRKYVDDFEAEQDEITETFLREREESSEKGLAASPSSQDDK